MNRRRFQCKPLGMFALAIATAGMCGCGSDRPKTIPIDGHVTINGQPPGEGGSLYFTPTQVADGYNKRPASGSFAADGHYRVMTWEPDDGLIPGHYTVNIMPGDRANTKIPASYLQSSTSGLEVDVPVDKKKIEFNIDIHRK